MSDNGKDFNRLRAQFSRRANAPKIPALASKLAWVLAFGRMDLKRRSTFVSQTTLANDLGGVTVRSVQRMIDVLRPLGLNVAPGHGPNRASTYWIGEANTTSMSPIEDDNTTPMSPIQPGQDDTGVRSTRHSCHLNTTPVSPLLNKDSKKGTKEPAEGGVLCSEYVPSRGNVTEAKTAADVAPLKPTPRAYARAERATSRVPSENTPIGPGAANGADEFRDITRLWPRVRIDDGKAHEVFLRIMAAGQSLQAVIDAVGATLVADGDVPWLSEALALVERATTTSEPAEDDDD